MTISADVPGSKQLRVAVIGGGPSGLVTLKYLKNAHKHFQIEPIEARLFEAEASIGGTFAYRTYENAELVSSRQLTTFSDFRDPEGPDFLSAQQYCDYLAGYAEYFHLWDSIQLNTKVIKIKRGENGSHIVSYEQDGWARAWLCDAVAVCSGLHVTPAVPQVKGIEHIPLVLHSSDFKEKKQFGQDTNVVVLGTGETGMDLAYLAVTSPTKSVTLCHRDGFFCAPKAFPNPIVKGKPNCDWDPPPTDTASPSLFDSAYVHHALRESSLSWTYYDRWMKFSFWFISGTTHGLDQWIGHVPDSRFNVSKFFPNKSNDAMPYISSQYRVDWTEGYKKRSARCQYPIKPTNGRIIDLAPWPSHIDSSGVIHFQNNNRPEYERMKDKTIKPDVLLFATGYKQVFPFFAPDDNYPTPQQADMRRIWASSEPSVGYIGFVRPGFGAIPPISEMQAQIWIMSVITNLTPVKVLPKGMKPETHYRLRIPENGRIDYGVDHESYVYQLALDMGSAPSVFQMARMGWSMFRVWALSANFNAKFRLLGPWKWDGARAVMEGEVWDTIKRRSRYGNVTLVVLPMILYFFLSSLYAIVYAPLDLINGLISLVG